MKVLVFSLLVAMATGMPQHFDTHRSSVDGFDSFGTGSRRLVGSGSFGGVGAHTTRVGHSISGGFGSSGVSSFGSNSHASAYTNCERREVSPGYYEYDCHNAQPGEIVDEKVLWVPYSGSDQNVLIRVPNYNVRDIVRATTYAEGENNENIRVHVARPTLHHVVEGQFEKSVQQAPNVQLSYEPLVQEHEKVYGPPGEPFRPLSKRIDEHVGFRRTNTGSFGTGSFGTGSGVVNSNVVSSFSSVRPRPVVSSGFGSTGFSSGSTGFGSSTGGFSSRSGFSGSTQDSWPATSSFSTNNRNLNSGFGSTGSSSFSTGTVRDSSTGSGNWF